jgi:hypothetical protein
MLTSQQRKFYANRLRHLEQLGFATPFEYDLLGSQPSEAIVEQCLSPIDCLVFDLQDRGTLYVVWLSVAAERPGVCLYDFRFVPPWPDREFQALPVTDICRRGAYVLPNNWEFPRENVLNLHFGKTGWRLPSTRVEGILCALSATPIPLEYRHGAQIPVRVEFFGKSGRRLAETMVTLWADRPIERERSTQRAAERASVKPSVSVDDGAQPSAAAPRRSSLFDGNEMSNSGVANRLRANLSTPKTPIRNGGSRTVPNGYRPPSG